MKNSDNSLPKNIKTKTVLLCEACGGYHPEEDCEVVLVKIIKGKDCKLNMTKDQTFARPVQNNPPVETKPQQVITGFERPAVEEVPQNPQAVTRDIIPKGIKKNDPRGIRPSVSGPPGMNVPSMADMMKEPGM